MPVLILIAVIVVLAVVVFVAAGHGGGMPAVERSDYAPLDLGPLTATDVVLHRPPAALWGYNMQATDEALARIAESIRERDIKIVALEQLVTDLSREPAPVPLGSPYAAARHARRGFEAGEAAAGPPEQAATVRVPASPAPATPVPAAPALAVQLPPPIAPTAPDMAAEEADDAEEADAQKADQEAPDGQAPDPEQAGDGTDVATPLSAPVPDPADGAGPGEPSRTSGTGWPPELSHD